MDITIRPISDEYDSSSPSVTPKSVPVTPQSLTELFDKPASDNTDEFDFGGILNYWQTAIAAERKRSSSTKEPDARAKTETERVVADDGRSCTNDTVASGSASKNSNSDESTKSTTIQPTTDETLRTAFDIVKKKNLKKGVDYLIACNFLSPSPREIATFLRLHHTRVNPTVLGEYLGEGGIDGAEVEYWNLIRFNYVRAIEFVGMNVEEG